MKCTEMIVLLQQRSKETASARIRSALGRERARPAEHTVLKVFTMLATSLRFYRPKMPTVCLQQIRYGRPTSSPFESYLGICAAEPKLTDGHSLVVAAIAGVPPRNAALGAAANRGAQWSARCAMNFRFGNCRTLSP